MIRMSFAVAAILAAMTSTTGVTTYTETSDSYGTEVEVNYYPEREEETVNESWTESKWYGCEAYNAYSQDYYYEQDGMVFDGYETLCADGSYVDYGVIYID